jgi:hypothetical protein
MSPSPSVAAVLDPLVDDGLPLVDLEADPAVEVEPGVRPFALRYMVTRDDDPEFVEMTGDDVTFTFVNHHFKVDDL